MVVSAVCVAIQRVPHEPHDRATQCRPGVLRQSVFGDRPKIERELVRRNILSKVVTVEDNIRPCSSQRIDQRTRL